jgi:hypothetical protein
MRINIEFIIQVRLKPHEPSRSAAYDEKKKRNKVKQLNRKQQQKQYQQL